MRYPRVVHESPLEPYRARLAYAQHLLRSLDEDLLTEHREFLPSSDTDIENLGNEVPLGLGYTPKERNLVIVTPKYFIYIDKRTTTGRLKAEWVRELSTVRHRF